MFRIPSWLVVTICAFTAIGYAQDPCSMTLASLSPPTVHPYSLYDIRWQPPPAFEISATGSGFLWDQGYNICIDGVNASAGLSYGGLADEPSNTHADIFVSVNSTAVCPPSCLNVGTQALSLVDIYGVPSNSKNFVMDYPAYMLVVSDFTYLPVTPTNVNIIRRVTYEVTTTTPGIPLTSFR